MDDFVVTGPYRDIVADAALELAAIATGLREHIETHDSSGQVKSVSRGVLLRIVTLGDVMAQCVGVYDDDRSLSKLRELVGMLDTEADHD